MSLGLIPVLLIMGLCSGFAAGLLGIGGGMMMVPLLTLLFSLEGFAPEHIVHIAIATSLSVIFFTSMSSVYAHHRRGAVLWLVAAMLIPGVVIGSWLGPMIAAHLNTRYLAAVFGVFVAFSGFKMLKKKAAQAGEAPNGLFKAPVMSLAGLGIGVLSGLVGAGGGFITVPFLSWRGVAMHNAVATSAVMGFPIALFGTISYIYQGWGLPGLPAGSWGFIYVPAMVCMAAGSVLTAPFGAKMAHSLNVKQLRIIFAYLLLALAAYMFWKALSA